MRDILIKTQEEFDALPISFKEFTRILIQGSITISISRGNSYVVAWENSHVLAKGNSHVEAWENSHVEAWGNVAVHLQSDLATVILFMFAACFALAKGKITKKSKTATIIKPKQKPGTDGWLEAHGIEPKATVTVYKKVSKDFRTQEGTLNETLWEIDSIVTHKAWNPKSSECGEGKFHACGTPYFCDEFRSEPGDRYISVEVKKKDLYVWPEPSYPHKIAFRVGRVICEVDSFGKTIHD